jgi:hypothetical protein
MMLLLIGEKQTGHFYMPSKRIKMIRPRRKETPLTSPAFLPGRRGGAGWHITDAGNTVPSTLAAQGIWNVPFGDEIEDRFIRLHELLHAAHSPLDAPADHLLPDGTIVGVNAILLAEEVRINAYARGKLGASGLPPSYTAQAHEVMLKLVSLYAKTKDARWARQAIEQFFAWWMADPMPIGDSRDFSTDISSRSLNREELKRFNDLNSLIYEVQVYIFTVLWRNELRELMRGHMVEWSSTIILAMYIDKVLKQIDSLLPEEMEEGEPDLTQLERLAHPPQSVAQKLLGKIPKNRMDAPQWAKMPIRTAKLTKKLVGKKTIKSKWKATDMGVSPRNIHRITIDGQVFGKKKFVAGGSVLIDDSGSMHWKAQEIAEIVEAAPATVIAAYSGQGFSESELVIIAQNGKWADVDDRDNRPMGNGNEVDLPALEWLAEQPKPRIWVSDQQVVPSYGDRAVGAQQCLDFIVKNEINVVRYAREAAEVFQGKRMIYR